MLLSPSLTRMGTISTRSPRQLSIATVTGIAVAIGVFPAFALIDRHVELPQYTSIIGHWFAAVLVVVIADAVVWPLGNLLLVAGVALVFTLVFLHRRTALPLIAAHVVIWTLPVLEAVSA